MLPCPGRSPPYSGDLAPYGLTGVDLVASDVPRTRHGHGAPTLPEASWQRCHPDHGVAASASRGRRSSTRSALDWSGGSKFDGSAGRIGGQRPASSGAPAHGGPHLRHTMSRLAS